MTHSIQASHWATALANDLAAARDARWRAIDAAAAPKPRAIPKPPAKRTPPKPPAKRTPPGSLLLSPDEVRALDVALQTLQDNHARCRDFDVGCTGQRTSSWRDLRGRRCRALLRRTASAIDSTSTLCEIGLTPPHSLVRRRGFVC